MRPAVKGRSSKVHGSLGRFQWSGDKNGFPWPLSFTGQTRRVFPVDQEIGAVILPAEGEVLGVVRQHPLQRAPAVVPAVLDIAGVPFDVGEMGADIPFAQHQADVADLPQIPLL